MARGHGPVSPHHRQVALDKGGSVEAWAYALKEMPRARLIGTGDFIADRALRAPSAGTPLNHFRAATFV